MIGTSIYDYVFIRACIISLHAVAPLSIAYCLLVLSSCVFEPAARLRLPLPLEIWALAEVAFYVFAYLQYKRHLQLEAIHPPAPSRQERRLLFARCNATISHPEDYLRKWFLGAAPEQIKVDNIKDFFLWAFFNRGGSPGDDDEELNEYIVATEATFGRKFADGRGNAECLRLTLDKVDMLHRSLVWYWCVGFVDFLTTVRLRYFGFHLHRNALSRFFTLFPFRLVALLSRSKSPVKHLSYWHRAHTSKTRLPIVFIHGIGIGLYPYVDFLTDLNANDGPEDQVGIIAVEIMPVSFRITHPVLAKDEMCSEVHEIIKHHGWSEFVLVSHSYGTAISTHLLKYKPLAHQIASIVLIDPITFLLHLPDVAYNFTRRLPKEANEHQLYYFASMDMGVSHALSRCFFWSENILWKEDIGDRRVTVSLAERDLIVNTDAVGRYLTMPDNKMANNAFMGQNGNVEPRPKSNGHALKEENCVKIQEQEVKGTDGCEHWKHQTWRGQGLDVIWNKGIDHAQVFDSVRIRKPVVSAIRAYCTNMGASL